MRVGVIPFRQKQDRFQVCLISSVSKPDQMTFPKGMVKSGEGWEHAALRELHEEAGLKGDILLRRMPLLISPRNRPKESCIFYWCHIHDVLTSWPEKKIRDRIWHTIGDVMPFNPTRNAGKIYQQLIDLGLDQALTSSDAEQTLRQKIHQCTVGEVTVTST